jgi:hypothetical protein
MSDVSRCLEGGEKEQQHSCPAELYYFSEVIKQVERRR